MELIKKIKQAETQAQEIIEQAKVGAARQAEKARENCLTSLTEAKQERKKAIEAAVIKSRSESLAEIELLKAEAEKKRRQLHHKTAGKMGGAAAKVLDYLRG